MVFLWRKKETSLLKSKVSLQLIITTEHVRVMMEFHTEDKAERERIPHHRTTTVTNEW